MHTFFALMAEYQTAAIPLKTIAQKYFGHNENQANRKARGKEYPFPVFRSGGQKSEWMVATDHLARWLDEVKAEADKQYQALKQAS